MSIERLRFPKRFGVKINNAAPICPALTRFRITYIRKSFLLFRFLIYHIEFCCFKASHKVKFKSLMLQRFFDFRLGKTGFAKIFFSSIDLMLSRRNSAAAHHDNFSFKANLYKSPIASRGKRSYPITFD